ncbi:MAG: DUF4926 domain-containing protein [Candidatus Schekmanbacteria bacterium]|nr:DUF4926 domain-containing protein [Candidatus Schekmanbacteria bacterium]
MIKELDTVVLTHNIKEYGLTEGDIGVVVHCYKNQDTYEIEFVTADGKTIAVLTLSANEIRLMKNREILHVREIAQQTV